MLMYGFLLGGSEKFWDNCQKNFRHFAMVAAICVIALYVLFWWPLQVPKEMGSSFNIYLFLNCIEIWATILTICGAAKKYLSQGSPFLNYMNKAVYPYYIIHQTVIVFLGFYIVRWPIALVPKFILLSILSIILIFSLYHYLIRKTRLTRFLFGVKN